MFYIWTTPANLKIQLKPSMSETRNYLVANLIVFANRSQVCRIRREIGIISLERERLITGCVNVGIFFGQIELPFSGKKRRSGGEASREIIQQFLEGGNGMIKILDPRVKGGGGREVFE